MAGKPCPRPSKCHLLQNRAIEIAETNGIGCMAIANTNHWMRGGAYGWQAARSGKVFIAIDIEKLSNLPAIETAVSDVINDFKRSVSNENGLEIRYPGERVLATRLENLAKGIPINSRGLQGIRNL